MDLNSVWVLTAASKLLYMYVAVKGNCQGKTLAKLILHQIFPHQSFLSKLYAPRFMVFISVNFHMGIL